uniref:Uncharacterized protein n=1 Tax=Triticum urartu TaxID=4572 RepID=A0A8R7UF69_TRIUA
MSIGRGVNPRLSRSPYDRWRWPPLQPPPPFRASPSDDRAAPPPAPSFKRTTSTVRPSGSGDSDGPIIIQLPSASKLLSPPATTMTRRSSSFHQVLFPPDA